MRQVLLVFFGGGFGSVCRYLLALGATRWLGPAFPYGTVTINVLGSFLILIVVQLALASRISPDLRLAVATGVLGGFTTYSSFNYETIALAQEGRWSFAALNLGLTVVLCLGAGAAGLWIGKALAAT